MHQAEKPHIIERQVLQDCGASGKNQAAQYVVKQASGGNIQVLELQEKGDQNNKFDPRHPVVYAE